MKVRPVLLCLPLALTLLFAGDGIPPRGSADDYPAHQTTAKVAIGAALVTPAQVKKLFGEDLDKHGYVVFEIGMFPADSTELDVSSDDFRLRQGKEGSITRAATPHMVATDIHPQKSPNTSLPGNVHTSETVGVVKEPNGRTAVYTDTSVSVGNPPAGYPPDNYPGGRYPGGGYPGGGYPPPPPPTTQTSGKTAAGLENQVAEKSLPDAKTRRAVAGYVFFPKPTGDKHADYELMYVGADEQVSLKLAPPK